jgi:molybdenum cofactor biosynthesis enzyme MoaA
VLDRLAPHAQRLKLTGGEPALPPDFPAIVEYLDVLGVEFVVFTNGLFAGAIGVDVRLYRREETT